MMKSEVKNRILIWSFKLEYQMIASYLDESIQSFIKKDNGMTLKIIFDRAKLFLQIWVPKQTT